MKTLKEKGFNKRISMIIERGRLMSPKTGIVSSYRGIFYDEYHRKQHKHIHIIGDEGRASTVCLELSPLGVRLKVRKRAHSQEF